MKKYKKVYAESYKWVDLEVEYIVYANSTKEADKLIESGEYDKIDTKILDTTSLKSETVLEGTHKVPKYTIAILDYISGSVKYEYSKSNKTEKIEEFLFDKLNYDSNINWMILKN